MVTRLKTGFPTGPQNEQPTCLTFETSEAIVLGVPRTISRRFLRRRTHLFEPRSVVARITHNAQLSFDDPPLLY